MTKIEVRRDALASAVTRLCGAMSWANRSPEVASVQLARTESGRVAVRGTDLDLRASVYLDGDWSGPVEPVRVGAYQLRALLAAFKGAERIEIERDVDARLVADGVSCALKSLPDAECPPVDIPLGGYEAFTATASEWLEAVAAVKLATLDSGSRPVLGRIQVRTVLLDQEHAVASAADGHRLHTFDIRGRVSRAAEVLLDPRWFALVPKPTKNEPGPRVELSVTLDGKYVKLVGSGWSAAAPVMDLKAPDYSAIFPPDPPFAARVDRSRLASAVEKLARVWTACGVTVPMLAVTGGDAALELELKDTGKVIATTTVPATVDNGVRFHVNPRYLADALSAGRGGDVEIRGDAAFGNDLVPLVLESSRAAACVMPMRMAR